MPVDHATNLNLLALCFTMAMGLFLLFLPRRLAIIPVMVTACYITMGQVINISSLNFTLIRVLILLGWLRIICRGELAALRLNTIDRAVLLWVATSALIYNLSALSMGAFINQLGFLYNTLGIYFLFRCLILDLHEAVLVVKALAIVIIPLALAMVVEAMSQRNLFALLGGVPEFSEIRDGKVRAQGAFSHPILAGSFGATLVPLFVGLWWADRRSRLCTVLGLTAATIITATSASSGPLLTYLSGWAGLAVWMLRHQMRAVRWAIVVGILALHLLMNAPVWFIFARLGAITGGTGWHRSELIEQAINHLDEWWLAGTRFTAHWMPNALAINPDMADITNEYLRVGVDSGLLGLILFLVMIARSFSAVGTAILQAEKDGEPRARQIFLWALGCSFFAHIVTFFSVSYFDQILLFWLLLIAMIATANGSRLPEPRLCRERCRPVPVRNVRFARQLRPGMVGYLRQRV